MVICYYVVFLLEMVNVRALNRVLEQQVQLMVNFAPPAMDDKELVDEHTKIRKSLWAAFDEIRAIASSGVPNVLTYSMEQSFLRS